MSLVGFKAQNHPQQVRGLGAKDHVDDRALPADEFAKLQDRFRFTVDAAASPNNAKLPMFWTAKNSGLSASWGGARVYCNPPYSHVRPWIEKAWAEATCPLAVLLLPANRTEQLFWQDLIEPRRDRVGSPLRVEFLRGRYRFLKPGQVEVQPNERPPFGCCLCIWDRASQPEVTHP